MRHIGKEGYTILQMKGRYTNLHLQCVTFHLSRIPRQLKTQLVNLKTNLCTIKNVLYTAHWGRGFFNQINLIYLQLL